MCKQRLFLIGNLLFFLGGKNSIFLWHCSIESNSKMAVLLKFLGSSSDMIRIYFSRGTAFVTHRKPSARATGAESGCTPCEGGRGLTRWACPGTLCLGERSQGRRPEREAGCLGRSPHRRRALGRWALWEQRSAPLGTRAHLREQPPSAAGKQPRGTNNAASRGARPIKVRVFSLNHQMAKDLESARHTAQTSFPEPPCPARLLV